MPEASGLPAYRIRSFRMNQYSTDWRWVSTREEAVAHPHQSCIIVNYRLHFIMEYEVRQTNTFSNWLARLKDSVAKLAIARRIVRLENGNFGDSKSVGGGVFELRVDVGKGYRVYFTNKDYQIVILLVGGDKSTQNDDIITARKMAEEV